jgi:hypothetical protein
MPAQKMVPAVCHSTPGLHPPSLRHCRYRVICLAGNAKCSLATDTRFIQTCRAP